ncbi:MAG: 4Fe-4S binding protein [Pseudomonadota bacterium]
MSDVYKLLAEKLDQLPNGFPPTESGVELKILRKIFDPEAAEMALKLMPTPETAETIARRLKKPVQEIASTLDRMAEKGQVWSEKKGGKQVFELYPFVIGIWELQVNRLDKELSDLMAEYAPMLGFSLGWFAPAITRIVPVNATIPAEHQILRYEDVTKLLEDAKTFQVADCICRKDAALRGNPCSHTLETCLTFSTEERAFSRYPLGRMISKQQALDLLTKAQEEGLVHQTYNTKSGHFFICNCCPCCCPILSLTKQVGLPHLMVKSNFVAYIEPETCEGCGTCANQRCPMDAITGNRGTYAVDPERCIGCGVCTTICPTDSVSLIRKPERLWNEPPETLREWYAERAKSRNIRITDD